MDISNFFKQAIDSKASDLHLAAGSFPVIRVKGDLVKLSEEKITNNSLEEFAVNLLKPKDWEYFKNNRELDFSQKFFDSRFRINLHYQESKMGISARLIPCSIPSPVDIDFNEVIYNLTHLQDGLILVTGPSGSGKSTTLATMIDIINRERRSHIITIEDPIEYLFEEKQSIIEQRELGTDTNTFASALKYVLRQDPNVVMVGEMRDLETISAALTAAETGHLVLSTLHTSSAPETIARIVDTFPAHQHQQVLNQLSSVLRAVISQQLLLGKNGSRVVAREIMINNSAIANLIRRNQIEQMRTVIQTSQQDGMITMNKAIDKLFYNDLITEEVAQNRKRNLETRAVYY